MAGPAGRGGQALSHRYVRGGSLRRGGRCWRSGAAGAGSGDQPSRAVGVPPPRSRWERPALSACPRTRAEALATARATPRQPGPASGRREARGALPSGPAAATALRPLRADALGHCRVRVRRGLALGDGKRLRTHTEVCRGRGGAQAGAGWVGLGAAGEHRAGIPVSCGEPSRPPARRTRWRRRRPLSCPGSGGGVRRGRWSGLRHRSRGAAPGAASGYLWTGCRFGGSCPALPKSGPVLIYTCFQTIFSPSRVVLEPVLFLLCA